MPVLVLECGLFEKIDSIELLISRYQFEIERQIVSSLTSISSKVFAKSRNKKQLVVLRGEVDNRWCEILVFVVNHELLDWASLHIIVVCECMRVYVVVIDYSREYDWIQRTCYIGLASYSMRVILFDWRIHHFSILSQLVGCNKVSKIVVSARYKNSQRNPFARMDSRKPALVALGHI